VLAFYRRSGDETLLIVANLSRFPQYVELNLREFAGRVPRELFGHIDFPPVGQLPYLLTLGPYGFYWFDLSFQADARRSAPTEPSAVPSLEVAGSWETLFELPARDLLDGVVMDYVKGRRWFRSKARRVTAADIVQNVELDDDARLALLKVEYSEGEEEIYAVPLAMVREPGYRVQPIARLTVRARGEARDCLLVDGGDDPRTTGLLLDLARKKRKVHGGGVEIAGTRTEEMRRLATAGNGAVDVRAIHAEQSNSSWRIGDQFIMKLYRRVEEGPHPELEIARHLAAKEFPHVPPLAGYVDLMRTGGEASTLAIIHAFVPNEGDAWAYTVDEIEQYFEHVLAARSQGTSGRDMPPLLARAAATPPAAVAAAIGGYRDMARLLGRRTAELHVALAASDDPAFAPESFTPFSRRSVYQSLRNLTMRVFDQLRAAREGLAGQAREHADDVLARRDEILARFSSLREDRRLASTRIRIHGDYHLGQVLYTGKDFVLIDFEGEPARPLGERRLKRSPLVDVAAMLRSFDYAAESVLTLQTEGSMLRREDVPYLRPWAEQWVGWVSAAFLQGYLSVAIAGKLLPSDDAEIDKLLGIHLLEKALYEIGYELNNRPEWVSIPLRGIRNVL
jgi:maltose alpha-D-glucosyltransferase/alpha-amylase